MPFSLECSLTRKNTKKTQKLFLTRVCVCAQQCEWQFGKLVKHESGLEFHSSLNLSVNPPLVFVFFFHVLLIH